MPKARFDGAEDLYAKLQHVKFEPRYDVSGVTSARGVSVSGSGYNIRVSIAGQQIYFGHLKDKHDALRWADAVFMFFNWPVNEDYLWNISEKVAKDDLWTTDIKNLLERWKVLLQREGIIPKDEEPVEPAVRLSPQAEFVDPMPLIDDLKNRVAKLEAIIFQLCSSPKLVSTVPEPETPGTILPLPNTTLRPMTTCSIFNPINKQ